MNIIRTSTMPAHAHEEPYLATQKPEKPLHSYPRLPQRETDD